MYGLDGTRRLPEATLDWLSGYEGSTPVRVGNAAAGQFQLDVWGEVLDGLHLAREAGLPTSHPAWDLQRALLDFLEGHWHQPDNSLWEVRGPRRHFVHSKVMAWAGVDRAVHTVQAHGLDGPAGRWRALRDADPRGRLRPRLRRRPQHLHPVLRLARLGRRAAADPARGLPARRRPAGPGHRRRRPGRARAGRLRSCATTPTPTAASTGCPAVKAAFLACSFWLADALHATGRRDEAHRLFERLLGLRNDVGMLSEEYDTDLHRQVGNTPQAFSMVGLVNTARQLSGSETGTNAPREDQRLPSA